MMSQTKINGGAKSSSSHHLCSKPDLKEKSKQETVADLALINAKSSRIAG